LIARLASIIKGERDDISAFVAQCIAEDVIHFLSHSDDETYSVDQGIHKNVL
jgi:hypothetical protein